MWLDRDMAWQAGPVSGKPGRPTTYSDAAVQCCLTVEIKVPQAVAQGSPGDRRRDAGDPDGAYDTQGCHDAIAERGAEAVIPTRKNAQPWKAKRPGAAARNGSEFNAELENLAQFDRQVDCASIADRVLGLADVMHLAEAREFHELTVKHHDHEFKEYVAPRSISADIVDGLSLFLRSQFSDPEKNARYRPPSGVLMQEVAKVQAHDHQAFRDMVGRLRGDF